MKQFFSENFSNFRSRSAQATFPTKKLRQASDPESNMFLEVTERHPEILQRILSTLLNVVMFEDCKNQWSMSRPLFVLILLYEDYFRYDCSLHLSAALLMARATFHRQLRDNIIRIQPLDKQQQMTGLFEMLMEGVERNLLTRSRDR